MGTLKKTKMIFKTNFRLMQVKSNAEYSKGWHSALLSTFIYLSVVIKSIVMSILSDLFTQVLLYKAVIDSVCLYKVVY